MTSRDTRLDRLASSLTARERAVLVLRSWKEGRDEDRSWRWSMPSEQFQEFNRYIELMNGVNQRFAPLILVLRLEVDKLELRAGMLHIFTLWHCHAVDLGCQLRMAVKQTVSESEYAALQAKAREAYRPVGELAYVLTERHEGFEGADLEPDQEPDQDAHYERIVSVEAWERAKKEKERELARLVAEGVLPGQGRGKGLKVQAGAFYDRIGEPVPVHPEWAHEFDVLPDGAEDLAERKGRWLVARESYRFGPTKPVVALPAELAARLEEEEGTPPSLVNDTVALLKERLREGVAELWRELRAVELVVAEVGEEFGEDAALPELREMLDDAHERLKKLHREAERFTGPFQLSEPDGEEVARTRRLCYREGEPRPGVLHVRDG